MHFLPVAVRAHFILLFIYIWNSCIKELLIPPLRTEVLGWFVFFCFLRVFFNMGFILTHIGDNLQTQKKPKKICKREMNVPLMRCLHLPLLSVSCFVFKIFLQLYSFPPFLLHLSYIVLFPNRFNHSLGNFLPMSYTSF